VTELAFFCQFICVSHGDEETILLDHHNFAATRAGTGIHKLPSQRISCLSSNYRRLPSCSKLGRGMGNDCHPFRFCASGSLSHFISLLVLLQEITNIIRIIDLVTIATDAPQFSCVCVGDHFFDLTDPLGNEVRWTKHDCRVSIQQLYHASRYCRLPGTHFRLAVSHAVLTNRARQSRCSVPLGR